MSARSKKYTSAYILKFISLTIVLRVDVFACFRNFISFQIGRLYTVHSTCIIQFIEMRHLRELQEQ